MLSALHLRAKDLQLPFWYERFAKRVSTKSNTLSPPTKSLESKTLKICTNLFTFWDDEGKAGMPVSISAKPYYYTIDLLYWETSGTDGAKNEAVRGHYAWIKKFSAFMADT